MTTSKQRGAPLGYLSKKIFFGTLQSLSLLEEERLGDGRFGQEALNQARENARRLWMFLKRDIWDTREGKAGYIQDPELTLISCREEGRRLEFRYMEFFFSIEVEEGELQEKIVTIILRKESDNGSMELKSVIPLALSRLVSDGLPF